MQAYNRAFPIFTCADKYCHNLSDLNMALISGAMNSPVLQSLNQELQAQESVQVLLGRHDLVGKLCGQFVGLSESAGQESWLYGRICLVIQIQVADLLQAIEMEYCPLAEFQRLRECSIVSLLASYLQYRFTLIWAVILGHSWVEGSYSLQYATLSNGRYNNTAPNQCICGSCSRRGSRRLLQPSEVSSLKILHKFCHLESGWSGVFARHAASSLPLLECRLVPIDGDWAGGVSGGRVLLPPWMFALPEFGIIFGCCAAIPASRLPSALSGMSSDGSRPVEAWLVARMSESVWLGRSCEGCAIWAPDSFLWAMSSCRMSYRSSFASCLSATRMSSICRLHKQYWIHELSCLSFCRQIIGRSLGAAAVWFEGDVKISLRTQFLGPVDNFVCLKNRGVDRVWVHSLIECQKHDLIYLRFVVLKQDTHREHELTQQRMPLCP